MPVDAMGEVTVQSVGVPSESRLAWLDAWRGVAILLVVLGHAIQDVVPSYDANWLFRGIYMFHMPLFFFISGIVGVRGLDRPLVREMRAKTVSLLLPYASWFLIMWLVRTVRGVPGGLLESLRELPMHVDAGLWFLPVLFMITGIASLAVRIPKVSRLASLAIMGLVLQVPVTSFLGYHLVKFYFVFFAAGVALSNAVTCPSRQGSHRQPVWQWAALFAAYVITLLGWHRSAPVVPASAWTDAGLPGAGFIDLAYRWLAAAIGIGLSLLSVKALSMSSRAEQFLGYCGRNTLQIYTGQYLFLGTLGVAGVLWIPIVTAVALGGALAVAALASRVRLLRLVLYGGR